MELITKIFLALLGGFLGIAGTLWTAKRRENISTKKEQLKYFYAPMEILIRMNARGFKRYNMESSSEHDKQYIEKNIWYPNHKKTKEIIMNQSHHLTKMPEEILALLEHINVWLSEYELIHVKGEQTGPVFVARKGFKYPQKSDRFIYDTAAKLRGKLNEG